jgi:hypothetical protein
MVIEGSSLCGTYTFDENLSRSPEEGAHHSQLKLAKQA